MLLFINEHLRHNQNKSKVFIFYCAVGIDTFFVAKYLDRQANRKAESFCSSIQVDESVHSLLSKCAAVQAQCATWNPENEVTSHQAWFSGFLLNGYTCDIRTKNDKVISKFYEEFTD